MRRAHFVLLGLVGPGAFLAACLNASDTPPGYTFPEGGSPDIVVPPPPPAPPRDAAPDASAPETEAGPLPVTVVVLRGGAPVANATVAYHDAQGVLVDTKITDAQGRASRLQTTDTMVTVATEGAGANGPERRLLTFVGVQPGDTLTAYAPSAPPSPQNVTVVFPSNAPASSVNFSAYVGSNRCSDLVTRGDGNVFFSPSYCAAGPTVAVLAVARDANFAPLGFSFLKAQPIPTAAVTINTLPAWSQNMATFALTATNVSGNTAEISLSQIADGAAWRDIQLATVTGGTASHSFQRFPGYADALQSDLAELEPRANSRASYRTLGKRVAATTASDSLDASQLLPAIDAVTIDETTQARPLVSWTTTGATTSADGGFVAFRWFDTTDAGTVESSWAFVVPPGATSVRAPALPAAIATWAPQTQVIPPAVGFVESDLLATYADLRRMYAAFPLPDLQQGSPLPPTLPHAGTVRVTANAILPQ